jgi:hypothetical protein
MVNDKDIYIQNFIGLYHDLVPVGTCSNLIKYYDTQVNSGANVRLGENYSSNKALGRQDASIFVTDYESGIAKSITGAVQVAIDKYYKTFFTAEPIKVVGEDIKIQKTAPRGGYHAWHCEADSITRQHRVLTWTLYLNDIPEGEGETEFLWQGIRIQPKQGTVCIFPTAFTHTHRGNPVYSQDKYIATGWFVHAPE